MAKYNTNSEKNPAMDINYMGENAFVLSAKEELIGTVMTTFLSDGYYEKESETVERIKEAVDKVDPLFVAKLAVYVRKEGNLRSVSHLLAALIADKVRGNDWAKDFFNAIVVRPDDMAEIVACYGKLHNAESLSHIRPIPNAIKKAFKKKLESLDPYQIDKYKMNGKDINMKDLVNMFHPTRNEAFNRLMTGGKLDDLYDSKRLEVTMAASAQKAEEEEITIEEAKGEAIREVLGNVKGMPIMNMLRNLRNILLYCPDQYKAVVEKLINEDVIINSKQLPFRFVSAYQAVEETEVAENYRHAKKYILDAIEEALRISCKNIPVLEGKTAVLIDDSGSMRGDRGGSSRLSAFSSVSTAKIAHTFGAMMLHSQNDVYVGLFGDRLIDMPVKKNMKLMDFINDSYELGDECGGATEQGIYDFFNTHIDNNNERFDNIIVFSDCQIGSDAATIWYGNKANTRSNDFVTMFKEFRKSNPFCNVFVVNLRQYGKTNVFHRSQRIFNIAGWSTNIFELISKNAIGMDAIMEAIENVKFI